MNKSFTNLNRCVMGDFRKLLVWQKAKELAIKASCLAECQRNCCKNLYADKIKRIFKRFWTKRSNPTGLS
jgi:hypothetical protein